MNSDVQTGNPFRTLAVEHNTLYRYRRPVQLGPHKIMIRPRDSHDLRLLRTSLVLEPTATVTWMHDVFGNSVGVADFDTSSDHLRISSHLTIEHYPSDFEASMAIAAQAWDYPFTYDEANLPDLRALLDRHYPDPRGAIEAWARRFLNDATSTATHDILRRMTTDIKAGFQYNARYEEGTQTPDETLTRGSGTCRDFALLMMEGLRALGIATRFVSGYLYDPEKLATGGEGVVGGGATHAWVQVYLPGAGWVECDPTNELLGGHGLIRIAVARDPSQAIPISGSWRGAPDDYLGLEVNVTVSLSD